MTAAAQANAVWVGRCAALIAHQLPRIEPKEVRREFRKILDDLMDEPGRDELRRILEGYLR